MKIIKVIVVLVASIIISACSDSEISLNEKDLTLQERAEALHLDGTKRVYSKEFANDFYNAYQEAFNCSQKLYDGIEKMAQDTSTGKDKWVLRHKLTAEAEEIRFAVKKLGINSAISEKEIEAEILLNNYINQVQIFATNLSMYYSDYNENNHLDKVKTTLDDLGLAEDEIKLIEKTIINDSIE